MLESPAFPWTEADAMYLLLLRHMTDLRRDPKPADEEQLDRLSNALEAYEAKRWAQRKRPPPWAA